MRRARGIFQLLLLNSIVTLGGTSSSWADSSEISRRLERVAQALIAEYKAKRTPSAETALAIFTLDSDEKLAKKRVGFAMAELLTHKFVRDRTFIVVEREEIGRVMAEQKWQITGAVDPAKATQVGKLIGADSLLLGSVGHVGGMYQINARLVEVESGEVLATAFEELEAGLFEEEARPYLVLVPEREAIGLYLTFGLSPNKIDSGPSEVFRGNTTSSPQYRTIDPGVPDVADDLKGLGFRYFPQSWLMADLGYLPKATEFESTIIMSFGDPKAVNFKFHGSELRTSIQYVKEFSKRLRGYGGLGLALYFLKAATSGQQSAKSTFTPPGFSIAYAVGVAKTLLDPFARVGLEWRPRPRVGLAVFENIGLTKTEYAVRSHVKATGSETDRDITLYTFAPARFATEVTVSLYF